MKFTFIVPVFNGEKYIEKCISSILQVKRDDYEIVIVNDGSTDNTKEIIDRVCQENGKIKTISIDNSGLSVARNTGMENSHGEYIIFVDSDDWISTEIEYPMSVAANNNLDVCYFNAYNVFEEENNATCKQLPYYLDESYVYDGRGILCLYTKQDILHEAWRGIYRREFLNNNNLKFYPGLLYEDTVFWFEIMQVATKVIYTDTYCYYYLRHPDSIIYSKTSARNIDSVFDILTSVLSVEKASEDYLGFASVKLHRLIRGCEKNVDTSELEQLISSVKDIKKKKKRILNIIEDAYKEDDAVSLMNKYLIYSEFAFFLGVYDEKIERRVLELRDKVIKFFKERMDSWQLKDDSKTIGIYGSGRNSDVILDVYQKIYGEIKAKLYYIDSNKISGEDKHLNRTIINISDIEKYGIDEVVIASIRFEESMYQSMVELWPDIPTHRFYKGEKFLTETILTNNFTEILVNCRSATYDRKIFLLLTPEYDNIGDHLIAQAELSFFKKHFSDYSVIEVDNEEHHFFKARINSLVSCRDIIIITGGGYFGSLWRICHYDEALDIIKNYQNNYVFVMPQSVFFDDNALGERYIKLTQEIFDRDKLTICVREKYSYETLRNIGITEDKILLLPDIALSLNKKEIDSKKTNSVGFFTRTDKESIVTPYIYNRLKKYINSRGMNYNNSSMLYGRLILKGTRDLAVEDKLMQIACEYDLIVTDQLHCMIACVLLEKPCIAFKSISKKTEGGYEWIKDVNYIRLVNNIEDAKKSFDELFYLSRTEYSGYELEGEWHKLNKIIQRKINKER